MQEEQINLFKWFDAPELEEEVRKIKFTYAESLAKVKKIVDHLKITYQAANINSLQMDEELFLITFPLEVHSSICTLQFEIQLNFKDQETTFKVILIDQNGMIQVNEKNIRLQMCRYMLRLNSGLRIGSFFIHPLDGYIGLKLQSFNGKGSLIYQKDENFEEFCQYLETLVQTSVQTLRFYFLRIMILINRINIKSLNILDEYMQKNRYQENEIKNWRKLPPDIIPLLLRLKNTIQNNLYEPFNKDQYKINGPILQKQMLSDNKIINQLNVDSPNELQVEKAHEINSGGFSIIYGKDIKFTQDKDQHLKKHFVIKMDRKPKEEQKIKKEIEILRILSNAKQQNQFKVQPNELEYFKFTGTCPYIAQFYYVPDRSDILLMERYYYSSLDYFKIRMEDCLSLSSKLFIAHSIAMGLRYCHYYGIIHMDIKPANILIAKSLLAKITDFGEAINNNGKVQQQQVGKTLPYCAPEKSKPIGQEQENFTYAYDIFSFGVLLFELIFDRQPIDFRRQNTKILEEKYQKQSYSVRYNEEYDKTLGPQKLIKYLGRLCLDCLQPDPKFRPNIDKIVLILKDSLSYLDKMY